MIAHDIRQRDFSILCCDNRRRWCSGALGRFSSLLLAFLRFELGKQRFFFRRQFAAGAQCLDLAFSFGHAVSHHLIGWRRLRLTGNVRCAYLVIIGAAARFRHSIFQIVRCAQRPAQRGARHQIAAARAVAHFVKHRTHFDRVAIGHLRCCHTGRVVMRLRIAHRRLTLWRRAKTVTHDVVAKCCNTVQRATH